MLNKEIEINKSQHVKKSIPNIIHYCWFGKKDKPKSIIKYMDSWNKLSNNYQIIEWNESNFDINHSCDYVKEAYSVGKYAFVSDYVRLEVLYQYGGVYLDTDIEVVRDFDDLLENSNFVIGFENRHSICTAFIAAAKGNPIIKDLLDTYITKRFIEENESYCETTINQTFKELLKSKGYTIDERFPVQTSELKMFTSDYFSGQDIDNNHFYITENTRTIHHFESSWKKKSVAKRIKYDYFIPLLQKVIGIKAYDNLKKFVWFATNKHNR